MFKFRLANVLALCLIKLTFVERAALGRPFAGLSPAKRQKRNDYVKTD